MKTNHPQIPAIRAGFRIITTAAWLTAAVGIARGQGSIAPGELVAPKIAISGGNVNLTVQPSVNGRNYQLQASETLAAGTWQDLGNVVTGNGNNLVISTPHLPGTQRRFYRLALDPVLPPAGFALIPAGEFLMGDPSNPLVGNSDELPVHPVFVSAFLLGKYEVTKEEWDAVQGWGLAYGYTDLPAGGGKAANHPVHSINWYAMVKWCNARSQKEGLTPCYTVGGGTYKTGESVNVSCNWNANGYRLPTEAEWEKAARGGVAGKNFPWGTDTITHSQANYYSSSYPTYSYDVSPTRYFHPTYAAGADPHSSPVGSFAPNGYGLYDMAGNMWEPCWDWYGSYAAGSQTDPRGPATGSDRVGRGGSWGSRASGARCASRISGSPTNASYYFGFRVVRGQAPPVPAGFALIPAGEFLMGDQSDPLVGNSDELPVHSVYVSAFYMGKYEVTDEEWNAVRAWGLANGYTDLSAGPYLHGIPYSKGPTHPVHMITWYDAVKWCNARSEKEGLTPCYTVSGVTYKTGQSVPVCNWNWDANGYRLPTEAEWEKAARGWVAGKNFPWGTDTITHSQANYYSSSSHSYDVSPTRGYHPTYWRGGEPYSSPVGSFAPIGYGLYDMAGNMGEWCWDYYFYDSYPAGAQTDPRGPSSSPWRVIRGGCWADDADGARCAVRGREGPEMPYSRHLGFRVARGQGPPVFAGFALIPAGKFVMGDQSDPLVGSSTELPAHTVQVSAFYMGKYEVTKEEWDAVRAWGLANGYTDLSAGSYYQGIPYSKGPTHPVHMITWYDMVKWCNARSQKEGLTPCYTVSGVTYKTGQSAPVCNWNANGYRLPSEAEWEKAARGGVSGKNFPWGTDTISHSRANYRVFSSNGTTNYFAYDVTPRPPGSLTSYYHPTYAVGGYPYSSLVGSFAPNGYGLYDMAGNMWEWCWDWYGSYAAGSQTDPRGPASGSYRVVRGGGWGSDAFYARCAFRDISDPTSAYGSSGFRLARGQP